MPKLQDLRKTKEISLPSFPDSKVEIYNSLLMTDMKIIGQNSENFVDNLLRSLPQYIKSWNFTDENGSPQPITSDNLGFLKEEDVIFLLNAITEFRAETKKKLET